MENDKRKSKYKMYFNAGSKILENAIDLRKNETNAEKILWEFLKNNQIGGLKFRRQHAISNFIADFYCHQIKLVIEVDGAIHNLPDVKERDEGRSAEIESLGITIIRFTNNEIYNNIEDVIRRIEGVVRPDPNGEMIHLEKKTYLGK